MGYTKISKFFEGLLLKAKKGCVREISKVWKEYDPCNINLMYYQNWSTEDLDLVHVF